MDNVGINDKVIIEQLVKQYTQLGKEEMDDSSASIHDIEIKLGILSDRVIHLPKDTRKHSTIFNISRRNPYGEIFISDYLAYIFDLQHNGGWVEPINTLFKLAYPEKEPIVSENTSVEIIREFPLGNCGKIDLLIKIDDTSIIGIENKVGSKEHGDQTRGYVIGITEAFKGRDLFYIYLTPSGAKASSEDFRPISYIELLKSLKTLRLDWITNIRRGVIWDDFLTHIEEYIAMDNGVPKISERAKLYIANFQIISEIQKEYEASREAIFYHIVERIRSNLDLSIWEITDFSANRIWQRVMKNSWNQETSDLRLIYTYLFNPYNMIDLLLASKFRFKFEIQGYNYKNWQKSVNLEKFIKLIQSQSPTIQKQCEEKQIQYLPIEMPWVFAYKDYPIDGNVDRIVTQMISAFHEFSFLTPIIDESLQLFLSDNTNKNDLQ